MSLNKAKIFTITSVSGGTGKTTTVLNLSGILSNLEKKTLVLDLDLTSSDIAASLNLDYDFDIYNLYNDINNNKFNSLKDYVVSYNEFIDVLPSPKDPRLGRKIPINTLKTILYKSQLKYDVILIDTNHVLTDINLLAFDLSDEILFIINNDSMNLKSMKTFVSILESMNKTNYKIILNESINNDRNFYNKYDIKSIIGKSINYTIPSSFYIRDIDKYILSGTILTLNPKIIKFNKKAINNFKLIISNLLKEDGE